MSDAAQTYAETKRDEIAALIQQIEIIVQETEDTTGARIVQRSSVHGIAIMDREKFDAYGDDSEVENA